MIRGDICFYIRWGIRDEQTRLRAITSSLLSSHIKGERKEGREWLFWLGKRLPARPGDQGRALVRAAVLSRSSLRVSHALRDDWPNAARPRVRPGDSQSSRNLRSLPCAFIFLNNKDWRFLSSRGTTPAVRGMVGSPPKYPNFLNRCTCRLFPFSWNVLVGKTPLDFAFALAIRRRGDICADYHVPSFSWTTTTPDYSFHSPKLLV